DHVHVFAAAVVALAGVAFGVLVGQLGALGFHDGGRAVVLAGDQLNVLFLTVVFGLDGGKNFGVDDRDSMGALKHTWSLLLENSKKRPTPVRQRAVSRQIPLMPTELRLRLL